MKRKMKKNNTDFPVLISGIDGYKNWVRINEFHHKYKRGDYAKLADATGYSEAHVWRVLNAERGANSTILAGARKLVSRRQSPFTFSL